MSWLLLASSRSALVTVDASDTLTRNRDTATAVSLASVTMTRHEASEMMDAGSQ